MHRNLPQLAAQIAQPEEVLENCQLRSFAAIFYLSFCCSFRPLDGPESKFYVKNSCSSFGAFLCENLLSVLIN